MEDIMDSRSWWELELVSERTNTINYFKGSVKPWRELVRQMTTLKRMLTIQLKLQIDVIADLELTNRTTRISILFHSVLG